MILIDTGVIVATLNERDIVRNPTSKELVLMTNLPLAQEGAHAGPYTWTELRNPLRNALRGSEAFGISSLRSEGFGMPEGLPPPPDRPRGRSNLSTRAIPLIVSDVCARFSGSWARSASSEGL